MPNLSFYNLRLKHGYLQECFLGTLLIHNCVHTNEPLIKYIHTYLVLDAALVAEWSKTRISQIQVGNIAQDYDIDISKLEITCQYSNSRVSGDLWT